jgi:hypothetical protein
MPVGPGYLDIAALANRMRTAVGAMGPAGDSVRFVRAVSVPEDGSCLLLFEAGEEADVEAAVRLVGSEVERVTDAITVTHTYGGSA